MRLAVPLLFLLCLEGAILYTGQRRLFGLLEAGRLPRSLIYLWAMPGTVLHEAAHLIACLILRVPVGRIELFRPRRSLAGITLGQVEHAKCDPLRMALVAVAPLLLVPPLLLLLSVALLGESFLSSPLQAFVASSWQAKVALAYVLASSGAAAFPSPGDHIPTSGLVLLAVLLVAFGAQLEPHQALDLLRACVLLLAPAALAAALQLALFSRRA
jgi:hypothetical protein